MYYVIGVSVPSLHRVYRLSNIYTLYIVYIYILCIYKTRNTQCAQENASRSIHMICQPAPSTTADVSKYHALGLVHVYVSAAVLAYQ